MILIKDHFMTFFSAQKSPLKNPQKLIQKFNRLKSSDRVHEPQQRIRKVLHYFNSLNLARHGREAKKIDGKKFLIILWALHANLFITAIIVCYRHQTRFL